MEALFEKIESYAKTNFDLFKLKTINKSADVLSTIVTKIAVVIIVLLIVFFFSVGLAFWIGECLEKISYGFFIVAGFYALVALIVYYKRNNFIKAPVNNTIIVQMLKEKKNETTITE